MFQGTMKHRDVRQGVKATKKRANRSSLDVSADVKRLNERSPADLRQHRHFQLAIEESRIFLLWSGPSKFKESCGIVRSSEASKLSTMLPFDLNLVISTPVPEHHDVKQGERPQRGRMEKKWSSRRRGGSMTGFLGQSKANNVLPKSEAWH